MELDVHSEIGALEHVLLHAPGPEVDEMPPSLMHELLFDDILYGTRAREEHARFRAILEALGVCVHDTQSLLVEALGAAFDRRDALIRDIVLLEELAPDSEEELLTLDSAALAATLIMGVREPAETATFDRLFRLRPVPNLLFSRDAQIVLGSGVVIASMSRRARQREPLLSRFVFENHPELRGPILIDYLDASASRRERAPGATLEGGDVLILREGIILVGVSERTSESAVDRLVERCRGLEAFHSLIMVPLPPARSVMHLDTIFTRISEGECLVHAPMILDGQHETLSVVRIDLDRPGDWGVRHPCLLDALRTCGVDMDPVVCGGPNDYIRQTREQWTDGANSFAVRPGLVFLYERNEATALELARRGYEVVAARDVRFAEDGRALVEFSDERKYAVLIAGDELSRARGGPRCMTMPLRRRAAL